MSLSGLRKLAVASGVFAIIASAAAPAIAGGHYHGQRGYHASHKVKHSYKHYRHYGGHYYGGHKYHGRNYRGHKHYGHKRGGGGGKAAAIALGVIGGAIILNELSEARARDRVYHSRSYDPYYGYGATRPYGGQPYYGNRDYIPPQPYGDAQPFEGEAGPTYRYPELDDRLAGGRNDGGPEPITFELRRAFDACLSHARSALGNRGYMMSAPYQPGSAEDLGGVWKMTANVVASNGLGDDWTRAMYCEADTRRVHVLELI